MVLFKRNQRAQRRVVPGTTQSAPVVRYYRPETKQQRPILHAKEKTDSAQPSSLARGMRLLSKWGGIVVVAGLLIANTGITSVGLQSSMSEVPYRPVEIYKRELQSILNSSIWYKNKLTLSSTKFEKEIHARFPEISNASAVIPLAGRRLQIQLQFAEPLLRLLATGNQQAVISSDGRIVALDSAEKINASFRDLPSMSIPNITISEGQQILTGEEVGLFKLLVSEMDGTSKARPRLESIEFDVQKREIKARFESLSMYAKLTPEREARAQVGALVASLKSFEEQGIQVTDYIDVR
ncbi:hypothetical protein KC959_01715, partial [Candidatus Saccharibacteria bacterium]|nr:hypothetical protein [Candidatus Saccharibacteria bacterium]